MRYEGGRVYTAKGMTEKHGLCLILEFGKHVLNQNLRVGDPIFRGFVERVVIQSKNLRPGVIHKKQMQLIHDLAQEI